MDSGGRGSRLWSMSKENGKCGQDALVPKYGSGGGGMLSPRKIHLWCDEGRWCISGGMIRRLLLTSGVMIGGFISGEWRREVISGDEKRDMKKLLFSLKTREVVIYLWGMDKVGDYSSLGCVDFEGDGLLIYLEVNEVCSWGLFLSGGRHMYRVSPKSGLKGRIPSVPLVQQMLQLHAMSLETHTHEYPHGYLNPFSGHAICIFVELKVKKEFYLRVRTLETPSPAPCRVTCTLGLFTSFNSAPALSPIG